MATLPQEAREAIHEAQPGEKVCPFLSYGDGRKTVTPVACIKAACVMWSDSGCAALLGGMARVGQRSQSPNG